MRSVTPMFLFVTVLSLAMTLSPPSTLAPQGATIIVTSAADSGPGTLRQALLDAQSGDTITFDPAVFPPTAPVTISITSALPHIHESNLTLDASSAGVILDGSQVPGGWEAGLQIVSSDGNTIRGLQVSNFTGPGIAISGDARYNVIGGDRDVGAGPFGRGNLFSHNDMGIVLSTSGTSLNDIVGNLIGSDAVGTTVLANRTGVWICDGANGNVVGPDNVIAYNAGYGIVVEGPDSLRNTITQNSIHDNRWRGIALRIGGNAQLAFPRILDFDRSAGTVTGATCSDCTIEIFSDASDEGAIYEGQTTADGTGVFTFDKSASFIGPYLTATTTDVDGNTSPFSLPISGTVRSLVLQQGNDRPRTQFRAKRSGELADNRIGAGFSHLWPPQDYEQTLNIITELGLKRVDLTLQENEAPIDWSRPEYDIPPEFDDFITDLVQNGVSVTYVLAFWDKANHPQGWQGITSRFKTEEEIQRYLDFARFIVRHFKDRVQTYKIWTEPDNCGDPVQCVEVADMINLIRRAVPVIREEYPEAKVAIPSNVIFYDQPYLFSMLNSDIMPMVDVVDWQTMPDFGPSDESWRAFYANYPSLVQQIKDTASAHGFGGKYWASELNWWFPQHPAPSLPYPDSAFVDAKDHTRGIVMHLGMGVSIVGLGTNYEPVVEWPTVSNLCTVMAGATAVSLPVTIEGAAADIKQYGFAVPNSGHMAILWRDVEPVADDPGVPVTMTLAGLAGQWATGVDVLNGFEQRLITSDEGGDVVIRNLLIKDYPIILSLAPTRYVFLPIVLKGYSR